MRFVILLSLLVFFAGCAASKPAEDEFVTRYGVINGKDVIESSQSSNNSTHVSTGVSVSSGSGVAVGVGVLLGTLGGWSSEKSVRYHVDLANGEKITINHESDQFLAGDCVEIRMVPGNDSYPPQMKRIAGSC